MRKLLEENNNSPVNQDEGGDTRYLARITAQQQEMLDELQELKESHKDKQETVQNEVSVEEQEEKDITPHARKAVEVSKQKTIMQIITDKFALSVEKLKWKKIINQLRNLFGFANEEEKLLKELGDNNKSISSLLRGKNREKLLSQLRIAEMLRELGSKSQLSLRDINKILMVQKLLISELRNVQQNHNIGHVANSGKVQQQQLQMIISEQKLGTLGQQMLGAQGSNIQNRETAISYNIRMGGQGAQSNTITSLTMETNILNKLYPGYYLMHQQNVNVQLQNNNLVSIIAPLAEKAATFIINQVKDAFISAFNKFEKDLSISGNEHNYECNPPYVHRHDNHHQNVSRSPPTKVGSPTADPCKDGTCGHDHH